MSLQPDLQSAGNHSVDGVASSSTYPDNLDLGVTSCSDASWWRICDNDFNSNWQIKYAHLVDQSRCCQSMT